MGVPTVVLNLPAFICFGVFQLTPGADNVFIKRLAFTLSTYGLLGEDPSVLNQQLPVVFNGNCSLRSYGCIAVIFIFLSERRFLRILRDIPLVRFIARKMVKRHSDIALA